MFRYAAVLLSMLASPAWAGCWESSSAILGEGPRAEICYEGQCSEAMLETNCSNMDRVYYIYAGDTYNVLFKFVTPGKPETVASASLAGKEIDYKQLTCTEIDEGACFPVGR